MKVITIITLLVVVFVTGSQADATISGKLKHSNSEQETGPYFVRGTNEYFAESYPNYGGGDGLRNQYCYCYPRRIPLFPYSNGPHFSRDFKNREE
ncbi:uncharacterized protein LOC135134256 [Zophobas morio]|uniref:uncharacterized protein LOC135134256 n=1 Tax=Zophobas morio TaxID=2755281 RepID=UPI0030834C77